MNADLKQCLAEQHWREQSGYDHVNLSVHGQNVLAACVDSTTPHVFYRAGSKHRVRALIFGPDRSEKAERLAEIWRSLGVWIERIYTPCTTRGHRERYMIVYGQLRKRHLDLGRMFLTAAFGSKEA